MTTNYVPDLYAFLHELSLNNDRPWFNAHKDHYLELRELWLADINRLIVSVAGWWPEMATQTPKSAAFRIYRDTRFSLNKAPYKTFFSAALCPQGKSACRPGLYVHMGPENVAGAIYGSGIYGGLWSPEAWMLRKLRQAIVDNIEEWEEIVNNPLLVREFPGWCGDKLVRAPSGWPIDHPQIEYLRLKEIGKYQALGESFFANPDWPEVASQRLSLLKPLIDFIDYSLFEE